MRSVPSTGRCLHSSLRTGRSRSGRLRRQLAAGCDAPADRGSGLGRDEPPRRQRSRSLTQDRALSARAPQPLQNLSESPRPPQSRSPGNRSPPPPDSPRVRATAGQQLGCQGQRPLPQRRPTLPHLPALPVPQQASRLHGSALPHQDLARAESGRPASPRRDTPPRRAPSPPRPRPWARRIPSHRAGPPRPPRSGDSSSPAGRAASAGTSAAPRPALPARAVAPAPATADRWAVETIRLGARPTRAPPPRRSSPPAPMLHDPRPCPNRISPVAPRSLAFLCAPSAAQSPGEVAQLVEHTTENRGVAGSIPALAIAIAFQSQKRRPPRRRFCAQVT